MLVVPTGDIVFIYVVDTSDTLEICSAISIVGRVLLRYRTSPIVLCQLLVRVAGGGAGSRGEGVSPSMLRRRWLDRAH